MSADINAAAVTARAVKEAETALAHLVSRRDGLAGDASKFQAEIDRLVATEQRDAGKRLLDGDDTAPPNPRRKAKVAALREQIEAATGALALIEQRVSEASRNVDAARSAHSPNVLAVCSNLKIEAVANIRAALATLTPAIRTIVAAQKMQDAMLGKRFEVAPDADLAGLFHGEFAVKKIVEALPDRFKPDDWKFDRLVADAAIQAAEITATVEGRK